MSSRASATSPGVRSMADLVLRPIECLTRNGFRFRLRCSWVDQPKRWAAWMMLNPSNAGRRGRDGETISDPTIDFIARITNSWGDYDGCDVVNLYPFQQGAQGRMWDWRDAQLATYGSKSAWFASRDMQDNLAQIEEAGRGACLRVAGFGGKVKDRDWVRVCLERFEQSIEDCVCLDTTRKHWPCHPHPQLVRDRFPDDAPRRPWQPRGYRNDSPPLRDGVITPGVSQGTAEPPDFRHRLLAPGQ
jgi:hypothetical protein